MDCSVNCKDQETVFVDYTWCKSNEDQLITLEGYYANILSAQTDNIVVVVNFTEQFPSNQLLKSAIRILNEVKHRIARFIIVGLGSLQQTMLISVSLVTNFDFEVYETMDEAKAAL